MRPQRATVAEIDLSAVAHNVGVMKEFAGDARLLAVVKANGYGHGAVPVAETALAAGAHGLCVALVQEGVELRRAGIEAPILVLSEQPIEQVGDLVAHGLIATAYSTRYIDALASEAKRLDVVGHEVHLKIDTGMNRVGAAPSNAVELAGRIIARSPQLSLGGVFTHLATADSPDPTETRAQLSRFDLALAELHRAGVDPGWVHAANSAATIAHPDARRDMVRAGIALYGIAPDVSMTPLCGRLRPALTLRSRVSYVKRVAAGEGVSYGLRHRFATATTVATVPLGYADGVPRGLGLSGGQVLVAGRRRPIVGVVTMDQLMVDCGDDEIRVDDEVVLIGRQGSESIDANEWGSLLGTIGYEVVCAISARVPRVVV
ncbi:MAG: alanine racemase [Actinobacteria bacterium]|nr:alanine racemase [Actinomycetota bacterium]